MLDEPEQISFARLIERDPRRLISAASVLEAAMVLGGRKGDDAVLELDLFVGRAQLEVVLFDSDQLLIARGAFRRYGKGRHPAGLSFGDCISYALSKWTGEPLLFKGGDFGSTGVATMRT